MIRLSPGASGTSAEKFPCVSRRAATPCAKTLLTPESSNACPVMVILPAVDLGPTPLISGEVITIFGAVVSLGGVIGLFGGADSTWGGVFWLFDGCALDPTRRSKAFDAASGDLL